MKLPIPSRLARPTLGTKFAAGFAVIGVILLAVVGVSTYVSHRLAVATNKITRQAEPALIAAYKVGQDAPQLADQQAQYVLDGGQTLGAFANADKLLTRDLRGLSATAPHDARAAALVATMQQALVGLAGTDQDIVLLVQQHVGPRALVQQEGPESTALVVRLEQAAQRYIAYTNERRARFIASFRAAQTNGEMVEIILAAVALLIAGLIGLLMTRGIKRSVRPVLERLKSLNDHCAADLRDALGRMAEGDMTYDIQPVTPPIEHVGSDEIGQIAAAVNGIRERLIASIHAYNAGRESLQGMIGSVAETAVTVGSSSEQMASTSEEGGRANGEIARAVDEIAQGAERQAQMIEQAKGAVEDVVTAAVSAAGEARMTAAAAVETRDIARTGVGAAEEASQVMSAVRDSALEVNETIGESPPSPARSARSSRRSPVSPSKPTCSR